ncbi:hypothetical protein RclHR1_22870002 [Rhizophagus clarus]|uniref:Actin-like ATPase domain-containing protein n=1 Tax=Rhizophagus clarus TaxID=94130 RepID=A0A2Z6RPR3_9GLOM|nr:hypothetical protein RclHR1_22870002 [Rhizophagus clarus]GES97322.1 hypothetical protein GLOIN_2v1678379 [Rhizophagus clarus]
MSNSSNDAIRVVAAIDFGTTFSGFAYAHKSNPKDIIVHDKWPDFSGYLKIPTAVKYDESLKLTSWGFSALAEKPNKKIKSSDIKPAEKFKLHLSKMDDKNKPPLPEGLDPKTAITDYLREMGKIMKETIKSRWDIDFFKQVLIVMTIPAEFDSIAMDTIRDCLLNAGITDKKHSKNLKFTTEPEAAAIHCMKILKELRIGVDSSYIVVDCGGGTVDLTTRKLMRGEKIGETTERKGDYCGGIYIEEEFLKFLADKVGSSAINLVKDKHYGQLQYMIQEFCRRVKLPFNGQKDDFKPFDLDLEEYCPVIKQYVKGSELDQMEEVEWVIELKFEDVKRMFDPIVAKVLCLIRTQLNANKNCKAMFLVGGFSESKYLQARVRKEYGQKIKNISVPLNPMAAIVQGAVRFGLRKEVVATRVLKWTYGTDVARRWERGDPINRILPGGIIVEFSKLAVKGEIVPVDSGIQTVFTPGSIFQSEVGFDIYTTDNENAKFCDSPGVKLLGNWSINIPITLNVRPILFIMSFGEIEIEAHAFNLETGDRYDNTFELDI